MRSCEVLTGVAGEEIRKKQGEIEVDVRASWGAAVLRPYMARGRMILR
jgi:hypothetical protein